ncbi:MULTISPECIES: hypothetical protein [unclassified Mesorhizobium]|uniref:hypothetical protein n=1 Tax=unclassified Mesorhizobium TaxID=325217 RepID=UPI0030152396
MQLQKIEIDWDIHKLIEAERRGFDEPPYLALRRLLKLPPLQESDVVGVETAGVAWSEDGVVVPHGAYARMTYLRGRQVYEGRFLNGKLIVEGKVFDALSTAANAVAKTKDGTAPNLNGWNYWEVRLPGETEWRYLKALRDEAREELISKIKISL